MAAETTLHAAFAMTNNAKSAAALTKPAHATNVLPIPHLHIPVNAKMDSSGILTKLNASHVQATSSSKTTNAKIALAYAKPVNPSINAQDA